MHDWNFLVVPPQFHRLHVRFLGKRDQCDASLIDGENGCGKDEKRCHRVPLVNRKPAILIAGTLVVSDIYSVQSKSGFAPIASVFFNASTYDWVKRSDLTGYAISPSFTTYVPSRVIPVITHSRGWT